MPIIVQRDGALAGVLGAMGGRVHAQIHVQVLLSLLAGRSAQEAVDAPRWIAGAIDADDRTDTVLIESGCDEAARAALMRAVPHHSMAERGDDDLGHAQAIWLDPEPDAGSDFRADGAAAQG
jgi:gamma-glutamyltranspeptidase